jgi:hypothetical protein
MERNKKRLLSLVPLLMLTGVASTSYLEQDLFLQSCQTQPTCDALAKTLNWSDWLSGSSSAQFHFIDLLELISSF